MDIAKISELVDNHYEIQAEVMELEQLLVDLKTTELQQTRLTGVLPNGKKMEMTIMPDLAKLIIHHQATILRLQLEQIPLHIRQQIMNTTPRLKAGQLEDTR